MCVYMYVYIYILTCVYYMCHLYHVIILQWLRSVKSVSPTTSEAGRRVALYCIVSYRIVSCCRVLYCVLVYRIVT